MGLSPQSSRGMNKAAVGGGGGGGGPTAAAAVAAAQKQKALLQRVDTDVANLVDHFSHLVNLARVCNHFIVLSPSPWGDLFILCFRYAGFR